MTRPSWKNIGGLPGLLLTLQEYGVNEINIHSLSKMHNLLDALKTFIFLPQLSISYNDLSEHEPYKDNIMTIRSIHITKFSKTTDENSLKLDNKSEYKSNEHGKRVVDATETGENCAQVAKRFKTTADIVCYACEINPKRGKLLLEKCLELGLDSGPHLQLLKKGINVIKNDGTVFMSKDVCEEEGSISTFIGISKNFCLIRFSININILNFICLWYLLIHLFLLQFKNFLFSNNSLLNLLRNNNNKFFLKTVKVTVNKYK